MYALEGIESQNRNKCTVLISPYRRISGNIWTDCFFFLNFAKY